MAQDTTKKEKRSAQKSRNTIQLMILAVVLVCIALILVELYQNVSAYLAG